MKHTWILAQNPAEVSEQIAGIKEFSHKISILMIGEKEKASKYFELGCDEVFYAKGGKLIPSYAASFASVIKGDENIIISPSAIEYKTLAINIGNIINASIISECLSLEVGENLTASRMIQGGLANESLNITANAIIIPSFNIFASDKSLEAKSGEPILLENKADINDKIELLSEDKKEQESVDLNKASRIVGIGRGFKEEADIKLASELCKLIAAELGCSRPIAESEKWMAHDRYIGISSAMPKPKLYLAIGISGQIQHVVGIKDSTFIVAINKDEKAPIFEYADLGIVGDLYKIVPALNKALSK